MGKENKGWSTGLPSFGIEKIIKDTAPIEPNPKTKSRVINYDKQNKKEVWESLIDMLVSVAVTWFICLVIYAIVKMI